MAQLEQVAPAIAWTRAPDNTRDKALAGAWAAALRTFAGELAARAGDLQPETPEWFALSLELSCMHLDAARADGHQEALAAARVAQVIANLYGAVRSDHLRPDAQIGRKVRSQGGRGREGGRQPMLDETEVARLLALKPADRRREVARVAEDAGIRPASVLRRMARARNRLRRN